MEERGRGGGVGVKKRKKKKQFEKKEERGHVNRRGFENVCGRVFCCWFCVCFGLYFCCCFLPLNSMSV